VPPDIEPTLIEQNQFKKDNSGLLLVMPFLAPVSIHISRSYLNQVSGRNYQAGNHGEFCNSCKESPCNQRSKGVCRETPYIHPDPNFVTGSSHSRRDRLSTERTNMWNPNLKVLYMGLFQPLYSQYG